MAEGRHPKFDEEITDEGEDKYKVEHKCKYNFSYNIFTNYCCKPEFNEAVTEHNIRSVVNGKNNK